MFNENGEIKYHLRALQLSLAIHTLFFLIVIIGVSSSPVRTDNLIVIDFTIEEPVHLTVNLNNEQSRLMMTHSKAYAKRQEFKSTEPTIIEHTSSIEEKKIDMVPVVSTDISHDMILETQIPVVEEKTFNPQNKVTENIRGDLSKVATASCGDSLRGESIPNTNVAVISSSGSGGIHNLEKIKYLKANFSYIKDIIHKNIIYPRIARQMGWEGKVTLSFIIASDGHAKDVRIIQSAGREVLDRNAIETIKKASPFPKPPVEAQIIIPIFYKLN